MLTRREVPIAVLVLTGAIACAFHTCRVYAAPQATGAFFTGLGDLPGDPFMSEASDVSGDGTTVVGRSASSSQATSYEAFRWTALGPMEGLGDFGAPTPRSRAQAVSHDGSVVVGFGHAGHAFDRKPFVWTATGGIVELEDSAGVMTLGQAFDVSADGAIVVGVGSGKAEPNQAFRWTAATGMVGLGWLPSTFHDFASAVRSRSRGHGARPLYSRSTGASCGGFRETALRVERSSSGMEGTRPGGTPRRASTSSPAPETAHRMQGDAVAIGFVQRRLVKGGNHASQDEAESQSVHLWDVLFRQDEPAEVTAEFRDQGSERVPIL